MLPKWGGPRDWDGITTNRAELEKEAWQGKAAGGGGRGRGAKAQTGAGEGQLETLSSRRAAGTGREDLQPHTNPSQLWFVLKCDHFMQSCDGKQIARKPPLGGFGG